MKVLVTGAAGFIGFHTARALLDRGDTVVGIDNMNSYYDVRLKDARLGELTGRNGFQFHKIDIADRTAMAELFAAEKFDRVVHLAAQAGVRYSIENPQAYLDSNMQGFLNILEGCRNNPVAHCVFASSSSVYGANTRMPYSERDGVDHPLSLYAATKKSNELMAHSYAHLYGIPLTGLRFFTVYGPWGRPDMAPYKFTKNILEGKPIDVYNHGHHARDFTFIDDIVEGVVRTLDVAATGDDHWTSDAPRADTSSAPYRLYNIGNNTPVPLATFIELIEQATGKKAIRNFLPAQPGDVPSTFADVDALTQAVGFKPSTPLDVGLHRFVHWYRAFYKA
ncbi:MAG TPA: NAD-dependent epimerase [Hyphomicrobium sp.]|nr:NAD-dependent epimerase [Hyphomicrobium sp.]